MRLYNLKKIKPEYNEYINFTVLGENEEEVRKYVHDYVLDNILFLDGWGKSIDRDIPAEIMEKAKNEAEKWLDKDCTKIKECRFEKNRFDWIIKKEMIFEG